MLMRAETVDYTYVRPEHEAIHARLENWRRWVRIRPHGWHTSPMFRLYQSKNRQWEMPILHQPVDSLDALKVEKAVSGLPDKHRAAIRWCYVFTGNPVAMARKLAVSKQGLADLVSDGRTMLHNRL